jgi:alpha-galactosidase
MGRYIHGKGLKYGIYSDAGKLTCAKYPGSWGHEKQDAATFAQWGA